MDEGGAVRLVEGVGDRDADREDLVEREWPFRLREAVGERVAVQ